MWEEERKDTAICQPDRQAMAGIPGHSGTARKMMTFGVACLTGAVDARGFAANDLVPDASEGLGAGAASARIGLPCWRDREMISASRNIEFHFAVSEINLSAA